VVALAFADRIKRVARKFSAVGFNIVSARGLGVNAKGAASIGDYRKLTRDAVDILVRDKAEAEVTEVVKDRAPARKTARKKNAVLLHFLKVALGARILIFAYDDGRGVLPKKEDLRPLTDIRRQKFLCRKVAVGIR
jgi:hypothetical protein